MFKVILELVRVLFRFRFFVLGLEAIVFFRAFGILVCKDSFRRG